MLVCLWRISKDADLQENVQSHEVNVHHLEINWEQFRAAGKRLKFYSLIRKNK